MAREKLTPEEMTFQSFRHSQGDMYAQHYIFRFMQLAYGLEPQLDPTREQMERYSTFLGRARATGGKSHITPPVTLGLTFKELRDFKRDTLVKRAQDLDLGGIVFTAAKQLHQTDIGFLRRSRGVWPHTEYGQSARWQARIEQGRASHLMYYGLYGHSTGSDEFDDLYGRVWQSLSGMEGRVETLNAAVYETEMKLLGHAILGSMPEEVVQ